MRTPAAVPLVPAGKSPSAAGKSGAQSNDATRVGLRVLPTEDGARLDLTCSDQRAGQTELMQTLGIDDPVLCSGVARDLAGLAASGNDISELELNQHLAVVRGVKPADAVEALLAVQMAAVHSASMKAAQRLKAAETIDQQDSASNSFNKLTRTFAAQLEALKRHRSAGEQNVIVKHVHVYPGGQAVVGNVKTAGKHQELDCAAEIGKRPGQAALVDASAKAERGSRRRPGARRITTAE